MNGYQSRRIPPFLTVLAVLYLVSCSWFRHADPAGKPTAPEPIGGYEEISKRIYYPEELRELDIQGVVEVMAYVDTSGKVTMTEVTTSLDPGLDEIAMEAIRRTAFIPASQSGVPVPVWVSFPIEFSILDLTDTSTPFDSFTLEMHPEPDFRSATITIRANLNRHARQPHRFEMLVPLAAEKITVSQATPGGFSEVPYERNRLDLEEWLTCNIDTSRFIIQLSTRAVAFAHPDVIRYSVRLNHSLPAWECHVYTNANGPELEFGDYRIVRFFNLWHRFA